MKAIKVEMIEFNKLDDDKGYEVIYDGGYTKWVSKEKFENEYFKLADETGTKILQDDIWNFLVKGETIKLGDKSTLVRDSTITGFDVIGISSCVDPETYDKTIGEDIAREDNIDALWEHMGFVLQWAKFGLVGNNKKKEQEVPEHVARMIDEYKALEDRAVKLATFISNNSKFNELTKDEQVDMKDQLVAMQNYRDSLGSRLERVGIIVMGL